MYREPIVMRRKLGLKSMVWPLGVGAAAGETPSLTGEVIGETHRGLECAQAHPLRSQHQRGPI